MVHELPELEVLVPRHRRGAFGSLDGRVSLLEEEFADSRMAEFRNDEVDVSWAPVSRLDDVENGGAAEDGASPAKDVVERGEVGEVGAEGDSEPAGGDSARVGFDCGDGLAEMEYVEEGEVLKDEVEREEGKTREGRRRLVWIV